MCFQAKLNNYFTKVTIKFSGHVSKHLVHLYADYIEIVSLFSNNNYVSTSDIIDRFKDEHIILKKKNDNDQAEENDKNESWIDEIFGEIVGRGYLYKTDYPFEIKDGNKLRLKNEDVLNNRHKLYLFMLLSSNLYLFGQFESELTKEFELLSYQTLNSFLPEHAIVKSFGNNSDYSGTAVEKIRKLGNDLKITPDEAFIDKISSVGTKERGLDLIGWIPFDDNVPNYFSIFCQCACGKEWYKKLTESRRYERYYRFHVNTPQHAMFIPYSLINFQNSDFYQADEISIDTLLFERKRILHYLNKIDFFDSYKSKTLV